jgi:decaprenylphospho-beta-D-ribofuranose 2-oxidase
MPTEAIQGWGRHPRIDAEVSHPTTSRSARAALASKPSLIARGLGRSYGDSSLAPQAVQTDRLNLFLDFDPDAGVLTAQAGVSLDEILRVFVPRGWFLPVTPGTRFVTLGGAVASDVHGKSHHSTGCFSECVASFVLLLADGQAWTCSRDENPELFRATCGGMGLTGVILAVTLRLKPIQSAYFDQVTYKCPSLEAVLERFDETAKSSYSVAWIDCLSTGKSLGRSVLNVGEHAAEGGLAPHRAPMIPVPFVPPFPLVNPFTIKAFNALVYGKELQAVKRDRVHYTPFLYPLDVASDWNRLYGRDGFTQYQLAIPTAAGPKGLRLLLERIAASGMGSSLAVLKVFGPANANPLSFPIAGYTLALDFKVQPGLFEMLDELDAMVLDLGGRLYLTKDARMGESMFKRSYPRWTEFQGVREKVGAIGRFASLQSKRLGLD